MIEAVFVDVWFGCVCAERQGGLCRYCGRTAAPAVPDLLFHHRAVMYGPSSPTR